MRAGDFLRCACAILLSGVLGCGTEPDRATPPPTGLQPLNDTPQNAVLRLVAAYEQKKTAEYDAMFTGDFRFEFSSAADPTLVQEYSAGWFAADEALAALHLFEGGRNQRGDSVAAAQSIDLVLAQTSPAGDTTDARDSTKFKVLATRVDGVVITPPLEGQLQGSYRVIDNNLHRLFLVRGDAAVGLRAGQPADRAHWYVYRWVDETALPFAARGAQPQPTESTTWGRLKAQCR